MADLMVAKFIAQAADAERTGILYDGDADGIAAAVVMCKSLQRKGARDIKPVPLGRGQRPDSPQIRGMLEKLDLSNIIIVDSGSRAGDILPGVPTLIVDHHHPSGKHPATVFFNTYNEKPQIPASLAAYTACSRVVQVQDLEWVAAIGVVSDLGPRVSFPVVENSFKQYGRRNMLDLVVLVNAGYRHRDYKVELAFNVLLSASSPSDIVGTIVEDVEKHKEEPVAEHIEQEIVEPGTQCKVTGVEELEELRHEVQDEF